MDVIKLFLYMVAAANAFFLPLQAYVPLSTIKKRPTICLNMIVKDEKHVITRCLESVLPIIDYWVIVDTGSKDGTQKIIQDFMKEKNIYGELHEHEWVNFGHNREEALKLARFKADYILFMDADDVLHFHDDFKMPYLQHDCYLVRSKAANSEYLLTRLIKSSLDWHWHGVLHEYVFAKDAKQNALLPGVEYIYICDGARANDPEKYAKDASILHAALEKEPDNARYMFYLAQTYSSGNHPEKALECYRKRVEMGEWDQEVFWSMLQIGYLKIALNYDEKSIEESFVEALKFRPSRPEPYAYLVSEARRKGEYQKGYEIGRVGTDMPPSKDILFIDPKAYDVLSLEVALCAWQLGYYQESLEIAERLLSKQGLIEELKPYLLDIRSESIKKLNEEKFNQAIDAILSQNAQSEVGV